VTEEQNEIEEAADEAIELLQEAGLEDVVIIGRAFGVEYINLQAVSDDFDRRSQVQGALSQVNHRLTLGTIEENQRTESEEGEKNQR
jgi:hypothetical protein